MIFKLADLEGSNNQKTQKVDECTNKYKGD